MDLDISKCRSVKEALQGVKSQLSEYGARDLVYGYMIGPHHFVRNDVIFAATLSDELMESYARHGGLNADPVAENAATLEQPMTMNLEKIYNDKSTGKFYRHGYIKDLLKQDYKFALSFTLRNVEPVGFAAMTVFPKTELAPEDVDYDLLQNTADQFHQSLKASGLIGTEFGLSEKEILCLRFMGNGKTALDIASLQDVTVRTIELRLANARKKLHAKTTTEAVYKAATYGILQRGHHLNTHTT